MPDPIADLFLTFSRERLETLASRINDCLGRLSNDQIWSRGGDNENAVGNLVLHLCGNVRQWIISGVGAEADVRNRDTEFSTLGGLSSSDLQKRLDTTISQANEVIRMVPAGRLTDTITIQKVPRTILATIYTVVEHFGQHTGQIIFATKMLTGKDLEYYKNLQAVKPK